MKGDFTRDTFDASNHYTRVLMQQGRVQLDADWNEQAAIGDHRLHTLAADLIGPHGGPAGDLGFGPTDDDTVIAGLRDRYGRPLSAARADELRAHLQQSDFLIGTGRYYVGGLLCENDEHTTYGTQPGYPFTPDTALTELRRVTKFLIYLDVWERHITYLDSDALREVALGGPDTASRVQLVWQVKVLRPVAPAKEATEKDLAALAARPGSALRARAKRPTPSLEDCEIDPESRYRGAENQLYRVEIHTGGEARVGDDDADGATFTWSRENGSVTFAVTDIDENIAENSTSVVLDSLGRDTARGLSVGDWVEIIDEPTALRGLGGPIRRVHSIHPDDLTVVLEGGTDVRVSSSGPVLLRRWDHGDDVVGDNAVPVVESDLATPRWLDLEDGVQIQFQSESIPGVTNEYRAGDYWLIPARTATGDVEWPREHTGQADPPPLALPPRGVHHRYAPLAQASMSASGALNILAPDLRKTFAPLAT